MLLHTLTNYSRLSQAAYLPTAEAKAVYRDMGYPVALPLHDSESDPLEAYLLTGDGKEIVIAIRGSDEPHNWVMENCRLWQCSKTKAHSGFLLGADKLWWRLKLALALASTHGPLKLTIVGHSLGGALAQTLALKALEYQPSIWSFGAPRVGGQRFVDALRTVPHARVVHAQDPVPRLPMRSWGYKHHGRAIIVSQGQYDMEEAAWEKHLERQGAGLELLRSLSNGEGLQGHLSYPGCEAIV